MDRNTDTLKGRIKQAIGSITGNEKLKKTGRRDERAGQAKQKAGETIDVVHDTLEDVAETLSRTDKEK